jgi:hypothetical protein
MSEKTNTFHIEARRRGLLTMPFGFGRFYLSSGHDDAVVVEMIEIVQDVARAIL